MISTFSSYHFGQQKFDNTLSKPKRYLWLFRCNEYYVKVLTGDCKFFGIMIMAEEFTVLWWESIRTTTTQDLMELTNTTQLNKHQ